VDYKPITYGKSYKYPQWAEGLGFCMSFASMIWVPAYAIYYVLATPGSVKEVSEFLAIFWHVSRSI
jgi:solute carrier family 6 GABA transporter-like protein 1